MKNGIPIVGLNGCGKTTPGRIVSERTGLFRADAEDYFFPDGPEGRKRGKCEVFPLLARDLRLSRGFVLSCVRADLPVDILERITLAVLLTVPAEERARRIRSRSWERFGTRMLPGGDRYESEERFFAMCAERPEESVTETVQRLVCPVLYLNGSEPAETNAAEIIKYLEVIP